MICFYGIRLAAVVAFITQLVRKFSNIIIYACGTNNEHLHKYLSIESNRYKFELKRAIPFSIKIIFVVTRSINLSICP